MIVTAKQNIEVPRQDTSLRLVTGTNQRPNMQEVIEDLVEAWSKRRFEPVFIASGIRIDVSSPEGQWKLLVLACLYAAKVKRSYAERTMIELHNNGLLDLSRMAQENEQDINTAHEILMKEYRGLVDKRKKAESLFHNARVVVERWQGHILEAWRTFDADTFLKEMDELSLFKTTAFWYVRELRHVGLWPDVPHKLSLYVDLPVRTSLVRLGLVRDMPVKPWDLTVEECQDGVGRLCDGDCLPLYRQGRYLCTLGNPKVCLEECRVRPNCLLWK